MFEREATHVWHVTRDENQSPTHVSPAWDRTHVERWRQEQAQHREALKAAQAALDDPTPLTLKAVLAALYRTARAMPALLQAELRR